ncbi:OB-fold-containig protein [Pararhodobacter aggregans]|uniref:DUF1449 domain-containing protein n=1 Tax=Pararhodobacter aggregans TaxID=404875 RepID=A0A2T7UYD7_9RHOB|nr:OB-fold-containig protein [Pararhodobacter aggregans]PTX05261.1 uncharacterized protein DUF1449 [Pararhodobacter aggregans]PVE49556.1 hypothetical protein DDE23_03930 [Pararhodobacter aggregans]
MLEVLLSGAMAPFTAALGLLLGLLVLELVMGLMGGSLLGGGAEGLDAPEIDMPEVDAPEIDAPELDLPEAELPEIDGFEPAAVEAPAISGVASVLGLGRTPFMIWLASALLGFGAGGMALQSLAEGLTGSPLPAWLAAIPALLAGWGVARGFGGIFARLVPRDETQSVSETQLGRRRGIITQGTAARGRPAEVRVTDRHGNPHYLRAEPLEDAAQLAQGTEVLVLRDHRRGLYRLMPLE